MEPIRATIERFVAGFNDNELDIIVDEAARKATIRWICAHDISGSKGARIPFFLRWFYRAMFGARFGWYGVDVFHFDDANQIVGKFTYANYRRPLIRRELGA